VFDRFRSARPLRRNKSAKPPGYRHKRRETRRDLYDWITLWTAIIGVGLVCVGTGVTAYQAIVMREELRQSREQQRAWLKIEPKLLTGLILSETQGAAVGATVIAENVGTVPATRVWVDIRLIPTPPPGDMRRVPGNGDKMKCEKVKFDSDLIGTTVFPGERTEVGIHTPAADYRAVAAAMDEGGAMSIALVVCVSYDAGGAGSRMTQGLYFLSKEKTGRLTLGEYIPEDQLQFVRIGAGEHAD
jgi:hypothetical protein